MAASAACSHPHVFAHTLRFSARGFLALTKNAWFVEVPYSENKCPRFRFLLKLPSHKTETKDLYSAKTKID